MIRKEAWPFYRTISGVRLCWELEEPKGPKERNPRFVLSSIERSTLEERYRPFAAGSGILGSPPRLRRLVPRGGSSTGYVRWWYKRVGRVKGDSVNGGPLLRHGNGLSS